MNIQMEVLSDTVSGLQPSRNVVKVGLNTGKRRLGLVAAQVGHRTACLACWAEHRQIHDCVRHCWFHFDLFRFEVWLYADIPRVQCSGCDEITRLSVPWALEWSGFNRLFDAPSMSRCRVMPVRQAASQVRVAPKRLRCRVRHYVGGGGAKSEMSGLRDVGRHECGLRKGDQQVAAQCSDQLLPLSGRGGGRHGDGRDQARRDTEPDGSNSRRCWPVEQVEITSASVGHAQELGVRHPRTIRGDAPTAAREPNECVNQVTEAGIASGLSRCSSEQQRGYRAGGNEQMSELGASQLPESAPLWRRARHDRGAQ